MPDNATIEPRASLFHLELGPIAAGFGLDLEEVKKILSNGRSLAPFLEVMARKRLGFPPRRSTEKEDDYLIVTMRDSVSFARSADKGVGRQSADIAVLTDRLCEFLRVGVVDAHRMPFIAFYEVNPTALATYIFKNNLKTGSMSRDTFLSVFGYRYNMEDFRKYTKIRCESNEPGVIVCRVEE